MTQPVVKLNKQNLFIHQTFVKETKMEDIQARGQRLVRNDLENYSPASNLLHNEKIRELMAAGKEIYHFGFGQSPFPLMDHAIDSLRKHADKSSYLPVIGMFCLVLSLF